MVDSWKDIPTVSFFPLHWPSAPSSAKRWKCVICNPEHDWEGLPRHEAIRSDHRILLTAAPIRWFRKAFLTPADRAVQVVARLPLDPTLRDALRELSAACGEAAVIFLRRAIAHRLAPYVASSAKSAEADVMPFIATQLESDTRIEHELLRGEHAWVFSNGVKLSELMPNVLPSDTLRAFEIVAEAALPDELCRHLGPTYAAAREKVLARLDATRPDSISAEGPTR